MSDERRKTNKQHTGTVPKVKHHNNTYYENDPERSRGLTNNLVSYWQHPPDSSTFIWNPRRNQRNNYFTMNTPLEDPSLLPMQNGCFNFNGSASTNTSSSTSRRNSSGSTLKCDNVTKYPDKKQIEDKLHQIREYLKITNSLMTTMKNTDDQTDISERKSLEKMIIELKDSEKKLSGVIQQINSEENTEENDKIVENGVDSASEHSTSSNIKNEVNIGNAKQELETLKEQQLSLLQLQQKAENKLRDARQIQSNLLMMQGHDGTISKHTNSYTDFDVAINELEERSKRLGPSAMSNRKMQENILAKVESLQSQIISMHNANNEREQLIEVLDNHDAELRSQQTKLQKKLVELENKKSQVDQLVAQLQGFDNDEDEEEDIGRKDIVTLKDQLSKLKDMLEIVKNTENNMQQNMNACTEDQAIALENCMNMESFLEKPRLKSTASNDSNVLKYDNDTNSEGAPKQVNKNKKSQSSSRGVKPKISHKLALQTELESKKRELEELMGKHKASTSNLNHDVGVDIKSEFSCASNTVNDAWVPLISTRQPQTDSDRFSSDECQDDINDYPRLHENHNILSLHNVSYSNKQTHSEQIHPSDYENARGLSRTPDRNVRSSSIATSDYIRDQPRSNGHYDNHSQVQKQIQLIKSVCDSMLEQQQQPSNPNVQQLRNNLSPSPMYSSESRRFASPNPHAFNALNVVNPSADVPWFSGNQGNDVNGYQSWLATNTIQTQSFMLNTLNQCCQMLWLQQRELVSLRSTVTILQEKLENFHYHPGAPSQLPQSGAQQQDQRSANEYRSLPNQKTNHVSAAFSMPNLNQYNGTSSNHDPSYLNQSNVPPRLLDPSLNNVAVVNQDNANTVLHGVNAPNQMWNGQALNNQVAPGNRANNYWDNFRSYSRQNLLSTKNNEVLQNLPLSVDRSNTVNERTNPFSLISFSKCNSEQDSTNTSQENTPQRRFRHENVDSSAVIQPPDVLNVNKMNDYLDHVHHNSNHNNEEISLGFQALLNLNDNSSNHSNISEEHIFKECIPEQCKRRNEWNDEAVEEQVPKSKLLEELRENVYKEVASLISANEARPHFLIQLFRDLQMIGSDSLRLKILQSIQMVITHSLLSSQNSNRHPSDSQQAASEQDVPQIPESLSLQSTVWLKPPKNIANIKNNDYPEYHNPIKGVVPFLNDHDDEILHSPLIASLKQILLSSASLREAVKDTVFVKHFSKILDEVFEQYRGKKIRDIKVHLTQTFNERINGELGFIQFIQDNNPESTPHINAETAHDTQNFAAQTAFEHQKNVLSSQVSENIQNGDLAEADQSRILDEDIEEEGAVGGIFESTLDVTVMQNTSEGIDLNFEFPGNVEGLDQVPTRLPTKVKSRSTTPNKDRSNSRSDPDPF